MAMQSSSAGSQSMTMPGTTASVGMAAATRTTVMRPLVADPHTVEKLEE